MTKSSLFQAVCTVAMLAAVPALAQNQRPESGMTGPNGAPNPALAQPGSSANQRAVQNANGGSGMTSGSSMSPADNGANSSYSAGGMSPSSNGDTGSSAAMDSHSTHRSAMGHGSRAMHGESDTSQNAEVDRLNDQSYQSAQQGQSFSGAGSNSNSSGMTAPGGTSSGDMSSGAMHRPSSDR